MYPLLSIVSPRLVAERHHIHSGVNDAVIGRERGQRLVKEARCTVDGSRVIQSES